MQNSHLDKDSVLPESWRTIPKNISSYNWGQSQRKFKKAIDILMPNRLFNSINKFFS